MLKEDSVYGTGIATAFRRAAARLGIRVPGTADYQTRALPERVRAAHADGVFLAGGSTRAPAPSHA